MTDAAFFIREPTVEPVPLLVSVPHTGAELPPSLAGRLTEAGRALPDTDWHLHRLYDFVPALGGRMLYARYSRYVVDLNRDPESRPLYPGRFETGLVPTTTFDGVPLYAEGDEPGEEELLERRERYWRPYHDRLRLELDRLRERFGYALLFEAHSIRSEVPQLFEGRLPDLVLGDDDGRAAAPEIVEAVREVHRGSAYGSAHDRPFKGGWITRTYGALDDVEALQLEMRQALYMDEAPPFPYRADLADRLRPVLEATLRAFLEAGTRRHGRAGDGASVYHHSTDQGGSMTDESTHPENENAQMNADAPETGAEEESLPAYIIEAARSSRSKCRTCRRKIEKGTLRMGVLTEGGFYGPGHVWHHLTCAARRNPEQVEEAYEIEAWNNAKEPPGELPSLEQLQALREKAEEKRRNKKQIPYAEIDPSGRAKCKQCGEPIEKGSLRVALGREVTFGQQTRTAAINVHPRCVAAAQEAEDAAPLETTLEEALRENSADLTSEQLDQVLAEIG